MNFKSLSIIPLVILTSPAFARDNIQITGSGTVFPFTALAAQTFADSYDVPAPIVESVGTGAGVKLFCSGIGEDTPDIVDASRPMKDEEIKNCSDNGVTDIAEIKIGYDGIVFASAADGPDFALTTRDVYLALATSVVVDGKLVANPYTKWNEVNPALPDWKIAAFIPGEKHGTREVFEQKVLEHGCNKDELTAAGVAESDLKGTCIAVRKDGFVSDVAGDYSETLARLTADPQAIGVFGISFYEENTDKIKVATVDGIVPSIETIASGEYPVSRPLFVYVKKQHVGIIPNVKEFLIELASDAAIGPEGYLIDIGLVPLPEDELLETQQVVEGL